MTNDDLAHWDAAYVLGALTFEDRRTYRIRRTPRHSQRAQP
jgi:hypothetical protein